MERRYELDGLWRSIAMLEPGASALSREQALRLLAELTEVQSRLDRLRDAALEEHRNEKSR